MSPFTVVEYSLCSALVISSTPRIPLKVGGQFEGAPVLLLHHVGRTSGARYVAPMMYLAGTDVGTDADTVFVFASKGGAPTNPEWYVNAVKAGAAEIEIGTDTVPVQVTEVVGAERDRIYAEQARRYPGFAQYAVKAAGHRTIPVLALHRAH